MIDKEAKEAELERIQKRRSVLEKELKRAKKSGDYDRQERLEHELLILSNKSKAILFSQGKYRFPKDEMVEYAPGQFMPANQYYWLLDD